MSALYILYVMYRLVLFFSFTLIISLKAYPITFDADTIYNTDDNWISGQFADLPSWIFSCLDENHIISASDPCMTLEKGREQAVLRALFIYSLRNKAKLESMHEFFSVSNNQQNGVLQQKNKITSLIRLSPKQKKYYYKIEKEYTSLFNEVFLLVKIIPEEDFNGNENEYIKIQYNSQNEFMNVFLEDNYEGKELYIKSQINSQESNLIFSLKGNLKSPKINSYMNGTELYHSHKGCWYDSTLHCNEHKNYHADMINSFWNAYIISFAEFLFSYPYESSNIKYTGEIYSNGRQSQTDKHTEMSQFTVQMNIKAFSNIIGIHNNKLFVDWKLIEEQ